MERCPVCLECLANEKEGIYYDIIRMECCKKELCLICASTARHVDPRCPCCRSEIDANRVDPGTVVVCIRD